MIYSQSIGAVSLISEGKAPNLRSGSKRDVYHYQHGSHACISTEAVPGQTGCEAVLELCCDWRDRDYAENPAPRILQQAYA